MNDSPSRLVRILEKAARAMALFTPGPPLVAAVSGGADSIALLHTLAELAPQGGLAIAHLNHGIRGAEAARDAAFVRARCRELRLPLHEEKIDVPALAGERGLSLEMAAREARYRFFGEVLAAVGGRAVATAHTADDQAETVLLKLLRGAGPRGLAGMGPHSIVLGVNVVRPLLEATRADVLAYLAAAGKRWREDRTNLDRHPLRNRIRHDLLPELEARYNPGIRSALLRTADILREEEAWLRPVVEKALRRTAPEMELEARRLRALPTALARRVIREWLTRCGVPEERLTFDLVLRLEALAADVNGAASVDAGDGFRIVSEYGKWRASNKRPGFQAAEAVLRVPGVTELPEWGLRFTVRAATGFRRAPDSGVGVLPCHAFLDAGLAREKRLRIRSWRPGDRLILPGGSRKLQDLFTDAKVPREARAAVPVLVSDDGEIAWLAGGPVASGWRVAGPRSASVRILAQRLRPGS